MFDTALLKVESGHDLTAEESSRCLAEIFKGAIVEEKIIAFLKALQSKGESVSEILGFAKELSSRGIAVSGLENAVDTCGTGGSGFFRF